MKNKTKIYSICFAQAWEYAKLKIGTSYQLVEVCEDVDPKVYYMLCTANGTKYDETPEDEKCAFTVMKVNYHNWCIDRAMVLYKRRSTKLRKYKIDNRGKFPRLVCYEC